MLHWPSGRVPLDLARGNDILLAHPAIPADSERHRKHGTGRFEQTTQMGRPSQKIADLTVVDARCLALILSWNGGVRRHGASGAVQALWSPLEMVSCIA